MHPDAGSQLLACHAEARARAAGACERCGVAIAPNATPLSVIDGLPTPDLVIVVCDACSCKLAPELATISSMSELAAHLQRIRASRPRR